MNYATIVVDPPWDYGDRTAPWRSSSPQSYPLMSLAQIEGLPVGRLAAADAHLYLWVTLPLIREAYDIVEAWGFEPDTMLTWCKPGPGLGAGWRGNTEHLIVARRGFAAINPTCERCHGRARGASKCRCARPDWRHNGSVVTDAPRASFLTIAEGTWYVARRGEHSAKPDLFMDLIEQMSPVPRLEMFARRNRLGWDTWGNEALEHVEIAS